MAGSRTVKKKGSMMLPDARRSEKNKLSRFPEENVHVREFDANLTRI